MRLPIFGNAEDYAAFERVVADSLDRADAPGLLAYCFMPNHWHLVVQAGEQTNLSTWMQWVTVTHTHRWHTHSQTVGQGPLYQGRFKSFPVQADVHFLRVCRYVEANAVRAGLVPQAEQWPWGSLWCRSHRRAALFDKLTTWPVDRPGNWSDDVNRPMDEEALKSVRRSVSKGLPLGMPDWQAKTAGRLGLQTTVRRRGRPCNGIRQFTLDAAL